MATFVRTGHSGSEFSKFYKETEVLLKDFKKLLDSKNKKIIEEVLKDGEHFWNPVQAKDRSDFEGMIKDYIKDSKKKLDKVKDFIESVSKK